MVIKNNLIKLGDELQKPMLWAQDQYQSGLSLMKNDLKVQNIALGIIKILSAALASIVGLVPYALGKAMQKAFDQKEVKPVVGTPQPQQNHPKTVVQSQDKPDRPELQVNPTRTNKAPKNPWVNNNAMPLPKEKVRFQHNSKYDGERQEILDSLFYGDNTQETGVSAEKNGKFRHNSKYDGERQEILNSLFSDGNDQKAEVSPEAKNRRFRHDPQYDGLRREILDSFITYTDERPINVADSVERPSNTRKPQSMYVPRKEPAFDVGGPVHVYRNGQWVPMSGVEKDYSDVVSYTSSSVSNSTGSTPPPLEVKVRGEWVQLAEDEDVSDLVSEDSDYFSAHGSMPDLDDGSDDEGAAIGHEPDAAIAQKQSARRAHPVNLLPYLLRIETVRNNILAAVANKMLTPVQQLKDWATAQMPDVFI